MVNITTSALMDLVCIGYLTLEPSNCGIMHILVISQFIHYAQANPIPNQAARTSAKECVFEKYVSYFSTKHMLWFLARTVLLRQSLCAPITHVFTDGKA